MASSIITRVVAGVLGLGLAVTAAVMLAAPHVWYATLPGVSASGPFNAHFARDIGCANLVPGAVLLVRVLARRPLKSALVAVAGYLCLHAGVHAWELVGVHDAAHRVVRDLGTVYLPALLTAWFALDALKPTSVTASRVQATAAAFRGRSGAPGP